MFARFVVPTQVILKLVGLITQMILISYMLSFITCSKTAVKPPISVTKYTLKYFSTVLQSNSVHNLTWSVLLQPVSGRSGTNLRGCSPHALPLTLRGQVRLPLLRPAGRHGSGGPVRPRALSEEKNTTTGLFVITSHFDDTIIRASWNRSTNALRLKTYVIILVVKFL